jgi:hypothetical protein
VLRQLNVAGRDNHFILRGGERIKIGRVVFTVKELVNDKYRYGCSGGSAKSEEGSAVEFANALS